MLYSLFFAKARPEADFKYFSNSKALVLSEKVTYVFSFHGTYLEVCRTSLLLCLASLASKSSVMPV